MTWVVPRDAYVRGIPPLAKVDPATHSVMGLQSEERMFFSEVAAGGGSAWATRLIDTHIPEPEHQPG